MSREKLKEFYYENQSFKEKYILILGGTYEGETY